MEIITNAENRKNVVKALAEHFGERAVYLGPPTFAYQIGEIMVDRDGKIVFEDEGKAEGIVMTLTENGFIGDSGDQTEGEEFTSVQLPITDMDIQGIINLFNMLHSKQYLINKVTGNKGFEVKQNFIAELETNTFEDVREVIAFAGEHGDDCRGIFFTEDTVIFKGFPYTQEPTAIKAYCNLAAAMVQTASGQKRINPKETIEENEKYYMRSWLVRLGLGGREAKETRAFLLKGLKGHTAFRTAADEAKWKANRRAAREGGADRCSE